MAPVLQQRLYGQEDQDRHALLSSQDRQVGRRVHGVLRHRRVLHKPDNNGDRKLLIPQTGFKTNGKKTFFQLRKTQTLQVYVQPYPLAVNIL